MGLFKIIRGAGIAAEQFFGVDDYPIETERTRGSKSCARCGEHITHIYWVGGKPYGSHCHQIVLRLARQDQKKQLEEHRKRRWENFRRS